MPFPGEKTQKNCAKGFFPNLIPFNDQTTLRLRLWVHPDIENSGYACTRNGNQQGAKIQYMLHIYCKFCNRHDKTVSEICGV